MTTNFFLTLLLAIIQSATEFLPVSSSAHLVIAQSFGLTQQGIFSDVALHLGTLLAVIAYFESDFRRIAKNMFHKGPERRLVRNLIIATLPILIAGCVGTEIITRLRQPIIIAGSLIIFGGLLWISDIMPPANTDLKSMTIWDALCIGLSQFLAVVPGVSRSGITITCCRALGFSRRESAKFSMMLSVPTILAASAYITYLAWRNQAWDRIFNLDTALGTVFSAALGLMVIRFLMNWLRRSSFAIFAIYRIALGLFVIYYFIY